MQGKGTVKRVNRLGSRRADRENENGSKLRYCAAQQKIGPTPLHRLDLNSRLGPKCRMSRPEL